MKPMNLEEMKAIADKRTIGGVISVYASTNMSEYLLAKNKNDAEFIAMASNNWDKLIAVVEAAKKWKQTHLSKDEIALFKAIDNLETEMTESYQQYQLGDEKYMLSGDEYKYIKENQRIGNTVAVPRTGWSPNEGDLTLKYHGHPNETGCPWANDP